jgi:hypothetical protein
VIVTTLRQILFLGKTVDGCIHDYKLLKQELDKNQDWFITNKVYVDLGYVGIKKDYASSASIFIPHKKPRKSKNNPNPSLTKQQKEENKILSKTRVFVEHVIGGIKIFRCLSDRFRNHIKLLEDIFIGISAAIWNFKLLLNSNT